MAYVGSVPAIKLAWNPRKASGKRAVVCIGACCGSMLASGA